MRKVWRLGRPSPAMVVALSALAVALSGTAVGAQTARIASHLMTGSDIKNGSVTTSDIKDDTVAGRDIKEGAVNSDDVKDASLLGKDFKAGQLPAGPQGLQGPQGPKGDTGTVDTSNYYDKAESDGRFLGKSAQAVDSDKLGGLNADAFRREGDGAGGDLSATYPNPIIAASAIGSAEVAHGSLRLSDLAAFDVWQNAPPREFGAHTCDTEPYGVGGFGGRAGDLVLVSRTGRRRV